ncbi:hypothetical protein GWK47_049223 [Chionoecetes opilio]|uniref:Uncharacterized protein n=1 Tax=Chionoecetes opilio TaxID=41210 RepID=A0A8J4YAA3_CHIOP|nr:hypothetical protein GWK47_049223 [Chionoecetes opilio]
MAYRRLLGECKQTTQRPTGYDTKDEKNAAPRLSLFATVCGDKKDETPWSGVLCSRKTKGSTWSAAKNPQFPPQPPPHKATPQPPPNNPQPQPPTTPSQPQQMVGLFISAFPQVLDPICLLFRAFSKGRFSFPV